MEQEKQNKKIGRPSTYTDELGKNICDRISNGESLKRICSDDGYPTRETVNWWLMEGKHPTFSHMYKKATTARMENQFDELEEIAKDESIDVYRTRLILDTRKWSLSRMAPHKYGERVDVTSGGEKLALQVVSFGDLDLINKQVTKKEEPQEPQDESST